MKASFQVYKMSERTRGRVLIINIERFNGPDALSLTRHGSDVDVQNLKYLFSRTQREPRLMLELAEVKENLTAEVSVKTATYTFLFP